MSDNSTNGTLHALVIDDEPEVRDFVSTVLRDEGWSVAQSPSAEDAFERIDEALWAVVFCDVILGGANGFSVLRHFKENMPDAKVVLMTGHGSAAGALDATAFGAYDYLLKPLGPEELQSLSSALREHLRAAGFERAQCFDWQRSAKQTLDVYTKALGKMQPPRRDSRGQAHRSFGAVGESAKTVFSGGRHNIF